jgi:hypothetical protein
VLEGSKGGYGQGTLYAVDNCLYRIGVTSVNSQKWQRVEIVDPAVHWFGQIFYSGLESIDWLFRRVKSRTDTKAVRRAHHLYYVARRQHRRGALSAALSAIRNAFAALNEGDRETTFAVMGAPIVILMDQIARNANRSEEIRPELIAALGIFRSIQAEPDRCSEALDRLIEWLSHRVGVTAD